MEQWSVTLLPIGKTRAVDNMVSCSEVDILRVVSAYAEPQSGVMQQKIYNVTIYKTLKWTELNNAKNAAGN